MCYRFNLRTSFTATRLCGGRTGRNTMPRPPRPREESMLWVPLAILWEEDAVDELGVEDEPACEALLVGVLLAASFLPCLCADILLRRDLLVKRLARRLAKRLAKKSCCVTVQEGNSLRVAGPCVQKQGGERARGLGSGEESGQEEHGVSYRTEGILETRGEEVHRISLQILSTLFRSVRSIKRIQVRNRRVHVTRRQSASQRCVHTTLFTNSATVSTIS